MPAGHFVLCAGLSSNSGVLGNGCLIHCINTFPYYRSICTLLNILHYKLALLVYKCLQGVAPSYLADDLCRRGSTSSAFGLVTVSACAPTRLSTYGNRAFPVVASRVWNSLPHHVTSAQSLPVFCSRLKTHLFSHSFRWLYCCACEVTLVIMDTLIAVLTYLLTYYSLHTTLLELLVWWLIYVSGTILV